MDHLPASLVIDIDFNKKVNNFDNVRKRSSSPSRVTSRSISVISKTSSIFYYKRIEIQNKFLKEELREPINSFQLLYNV